MAYDRYLAILRPLSTYAWTIQSGLMYMLGVWCVSLILASPQLFIFRLDIHPAYEKKTCLAKFLGPNRLWELIYIAWTIFFQFLLPVCILIYCYTSVYTIINRNYWVYYYSSDNLKTINMKKLTETRFHHVQTTIIERDKNHVHFHYPMMNACPSMTSVALINKTSSNHHIRDMFYPMVYRLRRSHLDLAKNESTNSIEAQSARQSHRISNHFLSRARLKTIKLTFIVVLTYILCSTPFYIGSIIMVLHGKFIPAKTMSSKMNLFIQMKSICFVFLDWLMTIFSLLFNLNSCSNPLVCLILSGALFR
mgnify:CR=1 FL=1